MKVFSNLGEYVRKLRNFHFRKSDDRWRGSKGHPSTTSTSTGKYSHLSKCAEYDRVRDEPTQHSSERIGK